MTYFMTFVSETRWQIGCSGNLFRKYEARVARVGTTYLFSFVDSLGSVSVEYKNST